MALKINVMESQNAIKASGQLSKVYNRLISIRLGRANAVAARGSWGEQGPKNKINKKKTNIKEETKNKNNEEPPTD